MLSDLLRGEGGWSQRLPADKSRSGEPLGPYTTVSLAPDAHLSRGEDVPGRRAPTAPDELLDVLSKGGSRYHFFGHSAGTVVLVQKPPNLALKAA